MYFYCFSMKMSIVPQVHNAIRSIVWSQNTLFSGIQCYYTDYLLLLLLFVLIVLICLNCMCGYKVPREACPDPSTGFIYRYQKDSS